MGALPAGMMEVAVLHANHLGLDGRAAAAALLEEQRLEVVATVELVVLEVERRTGCDHRLIGRAH